MCKCFVKTGLSVPLKQASHVWVSTGGETNNLTTIYFYIDCRSRVIKLRKDRQCPVWNKKEMWWWMWHKQCMSPVIKKLIMIRVMCCFIDIWTIQRNWFPSVYILQALTRPADNTQPLDENFVRSIFRKHFTCLLSSIHIWILTMCEWVKLVVLKNSGW